MQRIRTLGLALVAVLALSGVAVSSASASSFLAHPTGEILGEGIGLQLFTTSAGISVECKTATFTGTATALKSLTQLVEVKYSACSALGSGVDVSPARYVFSADLKVAIENDIILTVKVASCKILVGPAGNENLNSVHYANEGADLKVNAKVTGITYTSSGGLCGASGNTATYTGEAKVMSGVAGGVVRWDKE